MPGRMERESVTAVIGEKIQFFEVILPAAECIMSVIMTYLLWKSIKHCSEFLNTYIEMYLFSARSPFIWLFPCEWKARYRV